MEGSIMAVNVAGIPFEGPYFRSEHLIDAQGVYTILDYARPPGQGHPKSWTLARMSLY